MTYKYQKCPSCFELSVAEEQTCPFCDYSLNAINYHPWRRFFARSFDIVLFYLVWMGIILTVFLAFEPTDETLSLVKNNMGFFNHPLLNLPVNALLLIPTEVALLAIFGNTPGKKLYRIKLNYADGKKPGLKAAFNRTLMMYLVGMGFLIPLVNVYALYLARKRLVKTGTTLWDIRSGFYVFYRRFSGGYAIWVFFLHFLLVLLFAAIMSGSIT